MDDNPWTEKKSSRPTRGKESPEGRARGFSSGAFPVLNWLKRLLFQSGPHWTIPPAPPGGHGRIVSFIVSLLLLAWIASGFFRVQEGDVGVVLRFGEFVRVVPAGLRYHFPSPIEQVQVVRVSVWNKIDGGLGPKQSDEQSLILSTDENMVHVNYTIMWKIGDVVDFLFNGRDPERTIRLAAESAMREIIGQAPARLVLTEARERVAFQSQELLQKTLDRYKVGVHIMSLQLQRVEPPTQVIDAFNDMQASLIDADRSRNEAEAYRNDKLPRVRGEAQRLIQEASGYKDQVILKAEGETLRFRSILEGARRDRDMTYMMLFSRIVPPLLAKMDKTLVSGRSGSNLLPHIRIPDASTRKIEESQQ